MNGSTSGRSTKKLPNENLLRATILWTQLFSVFTVCVCFVIVLRRYPSSPHIHIKYTSLAALAVWLLGDIAISVQIPYQDVFHMILKSFSLSLLLIVFLIFIRERKPVIFRYPSYMIFIPLLIPVAQFMLMETPVMREIVFMSLQVISIVVLVLLSLGYGREYKYKLVTIIGIILLTWGFAFFWILQEHYIVYEWAWGITNSLGVTACIFSFADLLFINESRQVQ